MRGSGLWQVVLRTRRRCPPGWRLTRAVTEEDREVQQHLSACASCAAEHRRLAALVACGGALWPAAEGMSRDTRDTISALLADAAPEPPARARRIRLPLGPGRLLGPGGLRPAPWSVGVWVGAALATVGVVLGFHLGTSGGGGGPRPLAPGVPSAAPASGSGAAAGGSRAVVRALGAARFTRVKLPPDEQIRVDDGVITLDVVPLPANERFRVITDDAEVEVHGTRFEVAVTRGRLAAVRVASGRVRVRSNGGALAMLDAGDEWLGAPPEPSPLGDESGQRPGGATIAGRQANRAGGGGTAGGGAATGGGAASERTQVAETRSAEARSLEARGTPGPTTATARELPGTAASDTAAARSAAAASFDSAWALLRGGRFAAAARAFAEVEDRARGNALEEDACYWRAVALARGGDGAEARRLLGDFVRRFPGSPRLGEANVALGWLLLEAGRRDDAKQAFDRAAGDPSAPVRASAVEGLRRAAGP